MAQFLNAVITDKYLMWIIITVIAIIVAAIMAVWIMVLQREVETYKDLLHKAMRTRHPSPYIEDGTD